SWDRRHIVHFNAIYDLPFGRGRRFGSDIHGVEETVLGGWQVSAIFLYNSGDPLTLVCGGSTLGNGQNTRPDRVANPGISNPSADQWFNTDAFACPAQYTLGNSGIGAVYGPGQQVWDTALMKNFYFTGDNSKYLQFRWQMYNALNHRNLGDPGVTVTNANTFGVIQSAGSPRKMEFALKFVF
ncbi:MAG: TonB-dependent receptor, partial [Terriglobales bacterium]